MSMSYEILRGVHFLHLFARGLVMFRLGTGKITTYYPHHSMITVAWVIWVISKAYQSIWAGDPVDTAARRKFAFGDILIFVATS